MCILDGPLGINAEASRDGGKVHRGVAQLRADAFIDDRTAAAMGDLGGVLLGVVEAAIIVHDHQQGNLVVGGGP